MQPLSESLRLGRLARARPQHLIRRATQRVPRELGRDTILGVVGAGVALLSALVSFRAFALELGSVQFGRIGATYGWTGVLASASAVAVAQAAPRHLIANNTKRVLAGFLAMGVVSSLLAFVALIVLAPVVLPGSSRNFLLVVGGTEIIVNGAVTLVSPAMLATTGYLSVVLLRLAQAVARLVATVSILAFFRVTLGGYLVVQLISAMTGLIGAAIYIRRHRVPLSLARPGHQHLADYFTYAVLLGLLGLQNDYDKAVLVQYGLLQQAGHYTAAYKLTGFAEIPVIQVIAASYKRFLELGRDAPELLISRIRRAAVAFVIYGAIAELGVIFLFPLFRGLLGEDYGSAVYPMLIALVPVVVLRGIGVMLSNGLISLGRVRRSLFATVVASAVSVALYYALIPHISWVGEVVGTLAGEAVAIAWLAFSLSRQTIAARVAVEEGL